MHTQINVIRGVQNETEIEFLLTESPKRLPIIPAGKMITDSVKMTFVYLLDEEDAYGHIHFTQEVWPLMLQALKLETDPVIVLNEERIRLTQFVEELTMLIFNIEGNNNYGEQFSKAVEEAFEEILKE